MPAYIKYLIRIALVSIALMSIFRLLLFFISSITSAAAPPHVWHDLLFTFLYGLLFDGVITAYVLMPPFAVLGITSFFIKINRALLGAIVVYFCLVYTIVIFILCADIPYFLQFGSRLSTAAFLWIHNGTYIAKMIVGERSFLVYLLLFIILSVGISWYFIKSGKQFRVWQTVSKASLPMRAWPIRLAFFVCMGFGLVIAARGSLSKKSPIRIGTAYFCNDQTLNKIANNPVFTFCFSLLEDMNTHGQINLMDDKHALDLSASYLKMPVSDSAVIGFRKQWKKENGDEIIKKNIVIIIMEGMGTYKMGKYHGPKNLTPHLNQLIAKSLYFDNIYAAGIHTFNGLFATLFSFPALYRQQPLEKYMDVPQQGLGSILKKQGYSTSYFTTHNPQFDNVAGFLKANDYENIYSDYPDGLVLSNNGVLDHKMFEFSIPLLNTKAAADKPFFAVYLTASDHKPYIIPDDIDFKPKSDTPEQQIIEYADWSIGHFLELASKQSWYNNTTFVLVADHGLNMGHTYDMPLSYHSVPLLIYTPGSQISDTLHCLGGQIDIAPSLLSLFNMPYENKTMGINLFEQQRPFMYFCADDKIGCLDKQYYLIIRADTNETLYKYADLSTQNYIASQKPKVDSMKSYTFSMMQSTEYILNSNRLPTNK
ncbi:MAG: sulfatase-like hydrolase/transferase [Bacteroidota bacterium]